MKHGEKVVQFVCFDGDASKMHAGEILAGRTYEIVPFVKEVLTIVDIGANVGATSVFFGLHYPQATIHSVEPQLKAYELLVSNVQNNPNNRHYNIGLFNSDKQVGLNHSWVESGTASIGKSWLNTQQQEMITLRQAHQWCQEADIKVIDILKIDTEGCEFQILSSMQSYLPSIKVLYVEYHNEDDRRRIDDMLAPTHVLFKARVDKAHCGELTYVRSNLGDASSELHQHRIVVPQ